MQSSWISCCPVLNFRVAHQELWFIGRTASRGKPCIKTNTWYAVAGRTLPSVNQNAQEYSADAVGSHRLSGHSFACITIQHNTRLYVFQTAVIMCVELTLSFKRRVYPVVLWSGHLVSLLVCLRACLPVPMLHGAYQVVSCLESVCLLKVFILKNYSLSMKSEIAWGPKGISDSKGHMGC